MNFFNDIFIKKLLNNKSSKQKRTFYDKQLVEKETKINNIDLKTVVAIYSAVDDFYSSCSKNYKIINIDCVSN